MRFKDQLLCYVKEADYSKYGLYYDLVNEEWVYTKGVKRIIITSKNQLQLNRVTWEELKIFADKVKDDIVYFRGKEAPNTKTMQLTQKEYDLIMEMRKNNNL